MLSSPALILAIDADHDLCLAATDDEVRVPNKSPASKWGRAIWGPARGRAERLQMARHVIEGDDISHLQQPLGKRSDKWDRPEVVELVSLTRSSLDHPVRLSAGDIRDRLAHVHSASRDDEHLDWRWEQANRLLAYGFILSVFADLRVLSSATVNGKDVDVLCVGVFCVRGPAPEREHGHNGPCQRRPVNTAAKPPTPRPIQNNGQMIEGEFPCTRFRLTDSSDIVQLGRVTQSKDSRERERGASGSKRAKLSQSKQCKGALSA